VVALVDTINKATAVMAAVEEEAEEALPGTATNAVSQDTGRLSVPTNKPPAAAAVMVVVVDMAVVVVVAAAALQETAISAASRVISQTNVRTKAVVAEPEAATAAEVATVVAATVVAATVVAATVVAATVVAEAEAVMVETIKKERLNDTTRLKEEEEKHALHDTTQFI
jgi:hypothetical protein